MKQLFLFSSISWCKNQLHTLRLESTFSCVEPRASTALPWPWFNALNRFVFCNTRRSSNKQNMIGRSSLGQCLELASGRFFAAWWTRVVTTCWRWIKKHHEKAGFHYPNLDVFFQRTPAIQGTQTGFWVSLQKLQQSQQSFGNSRAFNSAFMEFLPGSTFQLADERTLAMPDVAPLGSSGCRATRCTPPAGCFCHWKLYI